MRNPVNSVVKIPVLPYRKSNKAVKFFAPHSFVLYHHHHSASSARLSGFLLAIWLLFWSLYCLSYAKVFAHYMLAVACPGLCCSGLCCLSGSFGSACVCDWHCTAWVFVWLAVSVHFSMFLWSLVHFQYVLFVWQILIGVNVHVRFWWHVRLLLIISLFSCNVINI